MHGKKSAESRVCLQPSKHPKLLFCQSFSLCPVLAPLLSNILIQRFLLCPTPPCPVTSPSFPSHSIFLPGLLSVLFYPPPHSTPLRRATDTLIPGVPDDGYPESQITDRPDRALIRAVGGGSGSPEDPVMMGVARAEPGEAR